ncbi:MAG: ATP-binding cassette domain-containing protein [Nitrospiraceae bacterium]|nr:ATP-binding cassette domain-containing protein [Nitrospiraceae bacterium]
MCPTRPVIQVDDAVVSYREDIALEGVSLSVQRGEFVGVIGPNGAGKTTLLTVVNGLARLVQGRVTTLGLLPYGGDGHRVRKRVGYVAQVEKIDPRHPMTVRETVMVGAYGRLGWFCRPSKADGRLVDEILEQVGVAHLATRPVGHLSGGEYQRAAIARVLVQQPDIFLFDEPTASIDPTAQYELLCLVQEIHEHNAATILYVTHDLSTLPDTCSRVIHMKNGRITGDGSPAQMLQEPILSALYGRLASQPRFGVRPAAGE